MNCFFMLFIAVCTSMKGITANIIQSKINAYFSSETTKSFKKEWTKVQKSFEYATNFATEEGFGGKAMNLYINRFRNPLFLSAGYYHSDNQVQMVFLNMGLEELPHISELDVSLPIHTNVLAVDASVSKMIVHTSYVLFRNKSDIIFSVADQDPYKSSPFRFQQVENAAELAIIIEGCTLAGVILAKVIDGNIRLGHHQLRLTDCQFTVEIYSLGTGAPPVIASYLPKGEKGLDIEHLILRPLAEELVPKLQATMYSYVNMSQLISKDLSKFEESQENIIEETRNFMDQIVRSINEKTTADTMGVMKLDDFTIVWDEPFEGTPNATAISMSDMLLLGLDTLYCSHTGGPYMLTDIEIMEELRFSSIKVTGRTSVTGFQDDNEFAIEIGDFTVDINIDSKLQAKFDVKGWRYHEYSCPKMELLPAESLVVGYLLKELPKRITSYLNSLYNADASQLNLPLNDEPIKKEDGTDGQAPLTIQNSDKEQMNLNAEVEADQQDNEPDEGSEQKILNAEIEGVIKLNNAKIEGEIKLNHAEEIPLVEDGSIHYNDPVIARENREIKLPYKNSKNTIVNKPVKERKASSKKTPKKNVSKKIMKPKKNTNKHPEQITTPKSIHMSDNEVH